MLLSTRHGQVEQDRASPVQLYHTELAWAAAGEPRNDRQFDSQNDDPGGADRQGGAGHQRLRNGDQGERRGDGPCPLDAACISWRLELYDCSTAKKLNRLFLNGPLATLPTHKALRPPAEWRRRCSPWPRRGSESFVDTWRGIAARWPRHPADFPCGAMHGSIWRPKAKNSAASSGDSGSRMRIPSGNANL